MKLGAFLSLAVGSLVLASGGCGAGSGGKAVRPDDPTAENALGEDGPSVSCSGIPAEASPLVVDWKTNDQLELTVAMQKGVALVAYDCKTIRVVKGCSVQGKYAFTPIPSVLQEAVQIADADEVAASLPLAGATLGGEVKRGSSIDIGLAYVGKRTSVSAALTAAELSGSDCKDVTHFVRGASIGAFAMATGTKGEVKAAAEIFGVGAKAASSSSKKKLNSAGDLAACKGISSSSAEPPDACAAVVRLELVKVGQTGKEGDMPSALGNTCPEGFVPSNGRCAKPTTSKGYRCSVTDKDFGNEAKEKECKEQCDKGNMESCYNAGILTLTGAALDGPEVKVTVGLYDKACTAGIGDACTRLSHVYWFSPLFQTSQKDLQKAAFAARKGCDLLVPQACQLAAQREQFIGPADRFALYKRACNLGHKPACLDVADYLLHGKPGKDGKEGVTENPSEGFAMLQSACDAKDKKACEKLISTYKSGKLKDPEKAEAVKKKACANGVPLYVCK